MKTTIDIEQKLIETKEKELQLNEPLYLQAKQILEQAETEDRQTLERAGFDLSNLEKVSKKTNRDFENLEAKRVFHLDEIREIALNYDLRFLPSKHYKGFLPVELPQKIKEFESLSAIRDKEDVQYERWLNSAMFTRRPSRLGEYFVLAPKSEFKLQEKPKDPLMFGYIGNDYYYLIHKWGNDLSITNRVSGFLKQYGYLIGFLASMFGIIVVSYKITPPELLGNTNLLKVVSFSVRAFLAFIMSGTIFLTAIRDRVGKYVNNWNSEYK